MSNRTRFDELAAQWDSNPSRVQLASAVAGAMAARLPLTSKMRVLDFGAGTGLVTLMLAPSVGEMVAADVSPRMLETLEQKISSGGIGNVRTLVWDADEGDCPEAGFDAIVSSMSMHHVRDIDRALARFARALRPGGALALADLDSEDGTFHADPSGVHHHGFDRAWLAGRLQEAGFRDVQAGDAHRHQKEGKAGVRDYGVFLITARKPS